MINIGKLYAQQLASVVSSRRLTRPAPYVQTTKIKRRVVPLEERANPAPVQLFYVPLPETEMNDALDAIGIGGQGDLQTSITSLSVTENNTVIWYDHWEDGYEAILGNPQQATTLVWGDGDDSNGIAPGFATDPMGIPAGTVFRLRNDVPTPRNVAVDGILFDSPDRFGSNKTIAVSRAQFTLPDGTVLAGAVEVRDTRFYDTEYVAPIGTNTPNQENMFEYTSFFVQAFLDNTRVQIDVNYNGVFTDPGDVDVILNQGQTVQSSPNVLQGARVKASLPVQAFLLTGDIGGKFASRTYLLYSVNQASNDYFTPVGYDKASPNNDTTNDDVRLFIYNPNATAINVSVEDKTGVVSTLNRAAGASSK